MLYVPVYIAIVFAVSAIPHAPASRLSLYRKPILIFEFY